MRKVTINGVEYAYTWGLGALMIFESLTGESIAGKSLKDLSVTRTTVLHYACLRNGSADFGFSFAEFVQMLNEHEVVNALNEALTQELARWNQDNANVDNDETGSEAKKKEK